MREWLRSARQAKELSIPSMASMIGVSRQFYSMVERGERRPSPEKCREIATVLGFEWTKFYEEAEQAG